MNAPLHQPLWDEHAALLAERRALMAALDRRLGPHPSGPHLAQALLDRNLVAADSLEEQEGIGVLIGDEIVRRAGFEWVTLDDDYGSEPAVAHPLKKAVISPLSAVANRFEDGEVPFSVAAFIDEALRFLEEAEVAPRGAP